MLHQDRIRPAALPSSGQMAPKILGGSGGLVVRRRGLGSALGPAPGDLVLLTDPSFVAEPDFYVAGIDAMLARDRRLRGGEFFLNASIAPWAWA